jgi:hypothetical protein
MTRKAQREAVLRYRERMRRAGYRLVPLWVPDTRSPRFAALCRRHSRLASRHAQEDETLRELESLHDGDDWTA